MKLTISPKSLRSVLLVVILVLIAGTIAGFIVARNQLQEFAASISQMEVNAASVDSNIETLKKLQVTLKEAEDIKAKTNSITVPASEYPVSVIANITAVAKQAGVKLTSINYGDASTPSGATQTTPNGGAATGTAPAPTQATTPSGVTKKTVNVTVESPVSYDALMNFIKGIETDDMYMHITKISLTKADGKTVSTQPFTIEVYTK